MKRTGWVAIIGVLAFGAPKIGDAASYTYRFVVPFNPISNISCCPAPYFGDGAQVDITIEPGNVGIANGAFPLSTVTQATVTGILEQSTTSYSYPLNAYQRTFTLPFQSEDTGLTSGEILIVTDATGANANLVFDLAHNPTEILQLGSPTDGNASSWWGVTNSFAGVGSAMYFSELEFDTQGNVIGFQQPYYAVPSSGIISGTLVGTDAAGGTGDNTSTDGPLPLWAVGALGTSLVGIARRRLRFA